MVKYSVGTMKQDKEQTVYHIFQNGLESSFNLT